MSGSGWRICSISLLSVSSPHQSPNAFIAFNFIRIRRSLSITNPFTTLMRPLVVRNISFFPFKPAIHEATCCISISFRFTFRTFVFSLTLRTRSRPDRTLLNRSLVPLWFIGPSLHCFCSPCHSRCRPCSPILRTIFHPLLSYPPSNHHHPFYLSIAAFPRESTLHYTDDSQLRIGRFLLL